MDSFQAKIGWKKMRNMENKNYRFVSFRSDQTGRRKFQKKRKKIKISKNTIVDMNFTNNCDETR